MRGERLGAVLSVLYVVFTEGSTATAGEDLLRPDLAYEAVRLARTLTALLPGEPEVYGLLALLELTAARFPARTGPDGEAPEAQVITRSPVSEPPACRIAWSAARVTQSVGSDRGRDGPDSADDMIATPVIVAGERTGYRAAERAPEPSPVATLEPSHVPGRIRRRRSRLSPACQPRSPAVRHVRPKSLALTGPCHLALECRCH